MLLGRRRHGAMKATLWLLLDDACGVFVAAY
jgi:hypothetical protein